MNIRKYFSLIITILFLVAFVIYFLNHKSDFKALLEINPLFLILLVLLKVLFIFVVGLYTKYILRAFDKEINHEESFRLSILSFVGNYFTPFRGGAGIRAYYLKSKYQFPYSYFVSTLSGYYLFSLLISSILGVTSLIIIHTQHNLYSIVLYVIFISIIASCSYLILFGFPKRFLRLNIEYSIVNKLLKRIKQILDGWNIIIEKKSMLKNLIVINLLIYFVSLVVLYVEFYAIGISISFVSIILYVSLLSTASLISLTPGSIGIRETIFLMFSYIISVSDSDILSIAIIDRGIVFFVLIILYLFSTINNSDSKLLKLSK